MTAHKQRGTFTREARNLENQAGWTRDEALAVMCRGLASLLDWWGLQGDAEAVRICEAVLREPTRADLERENRELRQRIEQLESSTDLKADIRRLDGKASRHVHGEPFCCASYGGIDAD